MDKLKLTKFHYSAGGKEVTGESMDVMINPSSISNKIGLQYSDVTIPGSLKPHLKFVSVDNETLDFTLYFDGTGIVDSKAKGEDYVTGEINTLRKITAGYDGDQHEVTFVRIKWGSLTMNCRLTSLTLKYTLFSTSGKPLRAEAVCAFKESTIPKVEAALAKKSSPDLTHVKIVKAGYGLRHMCYDIYGDTKLDVAIAKFNGFTTRYMPEGTEVVLPPLKTL